MNTEVEVYDIETLRNLFTYTGYDYKNDKWVQYVICFWRNDYRELIEHLSHLKLGIGYNNEAFDYPVIHHLINHYEEYYWLDGGQLAAKIYQKSQEIIDQEFTKIADKNKYIMQLDLYSIMGYDSAAMHTSLKDLEIALRLPNVEEMPIHHSTWCKEGDEISILSYNKTDVWSTYQFLNIVLGRTEHPLYKGDNRIELRQRLNKKFGLNVTNTPDIRIGEQLMLKLYCKATGRNEYQLKKCGGTPRKKIALKDCIPHWANFKSMEFQKLKDDFSKTVVDGSNLKDAFSLSTIVHGIKIDYGLGGAHSAAKPGVYNADDYWMILDEDIGSLYPSIAIQLGIYPEHLGIEFRDLYDRDIVGVRLAEKAKPKAERDNLIMTGYKKAANCIYGKSNEENSPFYDPLYTLKTTIGGQMFISLWTEKLIEAIPEIKFLAHNTDGITYMLPRKDLSKANQVAEEMKELTGLFIEDNEYKMVALRDVK